MWCRLWTITEERTMMDLQAGYDLYAARKRLERSGHKLAVSA